MISVFCLLVVCTSVAYASVPDAASVKKPSTIRPVLNKLGLIGTNKTHNQLLTKAMKEAAEIHFQARMEEYYYGEISSRTLKRLQSLVSLELNITNRTEAKVNNKTKNETSPPKPQHGYCLRSTDHSFLEEEMGENITYDYIDFKELLKAKDPELMEMLALYKSPNGTYLSPYKMNGTTFDSPYYFKKFLNFIEDEDEDEDEDEVQDGKNEDQVHQDDYDDDELLQLSNDELLQHFQELEDDDDYD